MSTLTRRQPVRRAMLVLPTVLRAALGAGLCAALGAGLGMGLDAYAAPDPATFAATSGAPATIDGPGAEPDLLVALAPHAAPAARRGSAEDGTRGSEGRWLDAHTLDALHEDLGMRVVGAIPELGVLRVAPAMGLAPAAEPARGGGPGIGAGAAKEAGGAVSASAAEDGSQVQLTWRAQRLAAARRAYAASRAVRWVEPVRVRHVSGAGSARSSMHPNREALRASGSPIAISSAFARAASHWTARVHASFFSTALDHVQAGILAPDATPDDPLFGTQWHLAKMHVPDAWDRAHADGVVIAVIDTGVDCGHPDLAAACVPGRNVLDDTSDTQDVNGHGTIEAGAAAAVVDNGVGIAGVAWGARIMPIKAMTDNGSGDTAGIAAGIVWAADNGARVINLSLGGEGAAQVMADAATYAHGRGALLTASAGNMPSGNILYPAGYPEVLGVGATTRADERPSFGNFGPHVDVVAPGVSILTTSVGGGYGPFDGTSESTALASGIAALLIGQNSARTPDDLRRLLQDSAVDLGPPGRDDEFGYGRLDAAAALEAGARQQPEPDDPDPDPNACARAWMLTLRAFPDVTGGGGTSGWPPQPAPCPGCDGVQSAADRILGARQPLGPLHVVISPAGEPAAVLAELDMDGHGTPFGSPETHVSLCFPPPYRITLTTTATDGYTLCSYSEAEVLLSQTNFDRARGSRRGAGRWAPVTWGFQRCIP